MGESIPLSASGNAMEPMSREECESFLAGVTTVGRLAFASTSGQQLLPVNFVFRHGCVYFKTATDSVLAELAGGSADVAFEIDHPGQMTQHGWSVLVKGRTQEVSPDDVDLEPRGPHPWAPGDREILIELSPDEITGRRLQNRL